MILTKYGMRKLSEGMCISFTAEQEGVILERFSKEPLPYEWSEQDISEQIRQIILDYPGPATPVPEFQGR